MRYSRARTPVYSQLHPEIRDAKMADEVLKGLLQFPKQIPSKYFYDETGSALFDQICELDEYYLTRTETGILEQYGSEIGSLLGPNCALIELGSGSSLKTRLLLDRMEAPAAYVPVDISEKALYESADRLKKIYPELEVMPLCTDYQENLLLPLAERQPDRTFFFFPGSTIGNFHPWEACAFLSRIYSLCKPGDGLLIGFDLRKKQEVLEAAYNDEAGVTAAFNLNMLHHLNEKLGSQIPVSRFRHHAFYHGIPWHRIEMHLISQDNQLIRIGNTFIELRQEESILTECSYKYTIEDMAEMARSAGFIPGPCWTDPKQWFCIAWVFRES